MKNLKLFVLALLVTSMFVGCGDDDDTTKTVCKILSEFAQRDGDSKYSEYIYDDVSGLLVKINFSETAISQVYNYDSLIYNSSDQLIRIDRYSPETVDGVTNYTYVSGKITQIVESGTYWNDDTQQEIPFSSTADFTYNGSDIATITISGDFDNMGFKDFVYSDGNLATVEIDFFGNDSIWAGVQAISYDTKNSLSNYLVPEWDDVLFSSSNNNMMILVTVDSVRMGDNLIDIGDTLFNNTYTYNEFDKVLTVTSHPSAMEEVASISTYVWDCYED